MAEARPGRHRRGARLLPLVIVVAAVAGIVAGVHGGATPASSRPGPPGVPREPGTSWPGWGLTYTQVSAVDGTPEAIANVRRALAAQPLIQDVALMGWGTANPEPSPSDFAWSSLDRRIRAITATGGRPVITLCCAPDWMKGGSPGRTDWSQLETAPLPSHYRDFAQLAAAAARRYPQVHEFLVWNELKGFYRDALRRWDYQAYTALYNQVYDAIKAAAPGDQVGGPYVPMDSYARGVSSPVHGPWGTVDPRDLDVLRYWLAHAHGADFVALDATTSTRDQGLITDEFTATAKFAAINSYVRTLTSLPLWWAEWYVGEPPRTWDDAHRTAVLATAMIELARSGTAAALYWNPEAASPGPARCPGCLWTSTATATGGQPGPLLAVLQGLARHFASGVPLRTLTVSPATVRVLASDREILLVNTTGATVSAVVGGHRLVLAPYQVRFVRR